MNDFNAHILADEASTGGVVVGTGISAALLLFFQQSFERMLPYLIIAAVVILIDLVFGIRAAKRKGDRIRISRAIRRTIGKAVEYFCWVVLASSLAVATGYTIIETGLMLVVIGVELISIAQNWYFWKFGHKAGMQIMFHFSILDTHHRIRPTLPFTPEKINLLKSQVRELLTEYGPVNTIMFDGWDAPWGRISYSDVSFPEFYHLIKSIQPNCLVMDLNGAKYPSEALFYSDIRCYEQGAGQKISPETNQLPAMARGRVCYFYE